MLLSIALLILIVGTILIERTTLTQKSPGDLVPVKIESKPISPLQENKRK
jgi:hypothetical protein